jgi:hypothetical protein
MAVAQAPVRQPAPVEQFGWSEGARLRVDPAQAAAVVKALYATHGRVAPEQLLEVSRPRDAVLHGAFEWDNRAAAEAYRLSQARYVLRSLTVRYVAPEGRVTAPMRFVVKLQSRPGDAVDADPALEAATEPHVYLPVTVVQASEPLRQRWVEQAARELTSWRQRYHQIEQLAGVTESLDLVLQRLAGAE